MKTALITGITGQDGAYLAQFLLGKGYEIHGTYRRLSSPNFWRLQALGIFDEVNLIPADLVDSSSLIDAIKQSRPDEIYNLAAQSFVGASFEQPIGTGEITGLGVSRMLEASRAFNSGIKFYQASTSELYGNSGEPKQNEGTPFSPANPYAVAKLYGFSIARVYRAAYHMFVCNGILFNHESPLRGLEFVTRKVSNGVAKIVLGFEKKLVLGNLESKRDWGYAPDYVESMYLMMQASDPDDYVIATGESHSVRELAQVAFQHVGLDWRDYVVTDPKLLRPLETQQLCGDSTKARLRLGWKTSVGFERLVQILVDSDLEKWNRWSKGEKFPWDAPFYPSEQRIISSKYLIDR